MNNVLEDSLFVSQTKKFDEIQSIVRQFSAEYVGNSIIKDNIASVLCGMYHIIRWLFLLLGVFESGLERLLIFPSALLFVLLHFLFCAEDAVYIGTHGLEFFVIILEIMVSIVLGVLLNRKLLFFCSKVFHSKKLSIRRVLLQNLKCFFILGKFVRVGLTESFLIRSL